MTTATNTDPTATLPATQGNDTVTPADSERDVVVAETAAEAAELEGADSGETPEGESEEDKRQAEIDKATRRLRRRNERLLQERAVERERAERLAAELAEAKRGKEDGKPAEDPREIAKTLRLVEKTADATASVMKEANSKFKDFEAAVSELVEEIGPQIDAQGRPSPLMDAVLDLPAERAAAVLYHLGKNTEVAAELTGLTPARLGRRIAQLDIEIAAAAKPKPSAAAKPLSVVKPSAAVVVDETKLTDAQWYAQRKKAKLAG